MDGDLYLLVGFVEQAGETEKDRLNGESGTPLLPWVQDIETDPTGEVDVGVIHRRDERDLGRSDRIVVRKLDQEPIDKAFVWGVGWTDDGGSPLGDIAVIDDGGGDALDGLGVEELELGSQSRDGWISTEISMKGTGRVDSGEGDRTHLLVTGLAMLNISRGKR